MTIPEQIQPTKDMYGRQTAPLSGKALYSGTLLHDAVGPFGVKMHPYRHFTEAYLLEYHPLHSMINTRTKHWVIQVHRRFKNLFQPVSTHHTLQWSWQLKSSTEAL